ncbi:MAG: bifunctional sugar-1-phosphate nucleotidylyltransferase/acetyltransferase [Nitrospinota bacterium]
MKALILAGGEGRNLLPFTATRPKPLIKVGGRAIIENIVKNLRGCGVNSIYITVGENQVSIKKYLSEKSDFNSNIGYLHQKSETGIGGAVSEIKGKLNPGEYFLLVYGDVVTLGNIIHSTLQSFNVIKGAVASVCLTKSTGMFGNIYFDNKMKITKVVEKPEQGNLGNYVLAGVYILPSEFIDILEECGNDMSKALSTFVSKDELSASIWENDWIDIGFPWDILTANTMQMSRWESSRIHSSVTIIGDVKITGPVHIEEGVEIRSGSVIEGPSFIGKGSFIGNNVLIRKNTSIGEQCVIGYGVELKSCILFGNSRVGRLSFIGDSVIGSHVEIGAGTMTINRNLNNSTIKSKVNGQEVDTQLKKLGAFIGDNTEIGSGHTLMAGVNIEENACIPHHYTYPVKT